VSVWETSHLYIQEYINKLKEYIQEGFNAIINERTGASIIKKFAITRELENLESIRKQNAPLSETTDKTFNNAITSKRDVTEAKNLLKQY
jgi:hypothetical protein